MKKMVLVSLLLVFAFPFHAYPYTVYTAPGTEYKTDGIATYAVTGDMMAGMAVTAYFVGGGSQTVSGKSWLEKGGVSGNDWSLTEYQKHYVRDLDIEFDGKNYPLRD